VAALLRGPHDDLAQHPAGARDQDAHQRIPISDSSPTMKV
jgi:hypothetical protein